MKQPRNPHNKPEQADPLETLTGLGFGPDTVLMNDPKLFVDSRFLASLLVELQEELGSYDASLVLFQIGLLHGFRDAARICQERAGDDHPLQYTENMETTALLMRSAAGASTNAEGVISLDGSWPERHEAVARCARLGAAEEPTCWMSAGYTSGWLSGTLNRSLIAREIECSARGDEACRYAVREAEVWHALGESSVRQLLSEIPVEAIRAAAAAPAIDGPGNRASEVGGESDSQFDRMQPVVHIWGPVMVLPFTTLDEALGTIDMLGRDPGISEIRAVVVDLRERPLDDGFGAAALEQILETIESWNAQSIITGVCAESESAIASLEASHLVLRKDLSEAVATAFQISDAQRHFL